VQLLLFSKPNYKRCSCLDFNKPYTQSADDYFHSRMSNWITTVDSLVGVPLPALDPATVVVAAFGDDGDTAVPQNVPSAFYAFRNLCEQIGVRITHLQFGQYLSEVAWLRGGRLRGPIRDEGIFVLQVFTNDPVTILYKRGTLELVFVTHHSVVHLASWSDEYTYKTRLKRQASRTVALLMILHGKRRGNRRMPPELWHLIYTDFFV
jgi:hypothetical protein